MSSEKKKETEEKSEGAPPSDGKGGGNKLVLILSLVNVIVTVGMLVLLFISFKKEKEHTSVEDISAQAEDEKKEGGEHGGGEHGGGEHGGGEHGGGEHVGGEQGGGEHGGGEHGGGEHGGGEHGGGEHGGGEHGGGEHGGGEHGGGEHGGGLLKAFSKSGEKMVALDQFTVNLSTPGSTSPKFVRVTISLEVPNDETEAEVTQKSPQVRNAIIDLFNSKKPSELSTVDGREYLKEEIKSSLNSFLVSGKVKGVYFTSFSLSG